MHKTITKSTPPISGVRQLVRRNISKSEFENPIEEMDAIIPDKGHIAELWLKVKNQMKADVVNEKKKSHVEGMQASFEKAKDEVAHEVKTIQSIVNAITDNTVNAVIGFEQSLVRLSIKIAEKIIKKKIEGEDDIVMSVVRHALKTVKESSEITVLLNPKDFEALSQYEEFVSYENRKIKFAIDERVESGGCKIHSDWGVIDAQIDTQLEEVYTQLVTKIEDAAPAENEHVSE